MLNSTASVMEEYSLARWARQLKRSALQDMLVVGSKPDLISFAMGLPAPELFPIAGFIEAAARVLTDESSPLQYAPPFAPLRTQIVKLMARRGVTCCEKQILLTVGAQQGMNLLVRLLLDPGGQVLMDEVIYPGFQQVVEPYLPEILTVPHDHESGMDVEAVEELLSNGARPAFIYAISNGHNPLGASLTEAKRQRLVQLAAQYSVPILEDDPYGFLTYENEALPPLRAFDERWVFYIGSFSKILAPALRVGWIVVPETLIPQLSAVKEASDIDTSTLTQRLVSAFLHDHDVHSHIALLRRTYKSRRDAMLEALDKHFPSTARWHAPASGVFVWVEMPEEVNTLDLLQTALETVQVAFIPGQAFSVGRAKPATNCMRLNFSHCNEERIAEGIARLGQVCLKQ
jgi:2-aminoadipate transaminase